MQQSISDDDLKTHSSDSLKDMRLYLDKIEQNKKELANATGAVDITCPGQMTL